MHLIAFRFTEVQDGLQEEVWHQQTPASLCRPCQDNWYQTWGEGEFSHISYSKEIIHVLQVSRPQVIKKLYAYINENNLKVVLLLMIWCDVKINFFGKRWFAQTTVVSDWICNLVFIGPWGQGLLHPWQGYAAYLWLEEAEALRHDKILQGAS